MAKMTKKELGAMGKRITTEAKKIRKDNPKLKWTEAVARAGRKFRKK